MLFPGKALHKNQNKQLHNSHLNGAKSLRRVRKKCLHLSLLPSTIPTPPPQPSQICLSRCCFQSGSELLVRCLWLHWKPHVGKHLDTGRFCKEQFKNGPKMMKTVLMLPSLWENVSQDILHLSLWPWRIGGYFCSGQIPHDRLNHWGLQLLFGPLKDLSQLGWCCG